MPLRCIGPDGLPIFAFDLDRDTFEQLRGEQRRRKHLRFDCCDTAVALRVSSKGTQHFFHKPASKTAACLCKPITEDHLEIVRAAALAAREAGWQVDVEAPGQTPEGEAWRADVLAIKAKERIAIEVQWSGQSWEETIERQRRYARSGVRCVWLFNSLNYGVDPATPAFQVSRASPLEGYEVRVSPPEDKFVRRSRNPQVELEQTFYVMPLHQFVRGVLDGRLEWSPAQRRPLQGSVEIRSAYACRCGEPVWTTAGQIALATSLPGHPVIVWSGVQSSTWARAILAAARARAGLQLPAPGEWDWRCPRCGSVRVREWRELSEPARKHVAVPELYAMDLPRCIEGTAEASFVRRWWMHAEGR